MEIKYKRLLSLLRSEPWAITHAKLAEIESVIELKLQDVALNADDVEARIGQATQSNSSKQGSIAVLPLHGVISHRVGGFNEWNGGISTERFAGYFRQALGDDSVKSILIDVDSPGGTIAGVTELHKEIMSARGQKPVVAHVNALCASAGYWIASAADEIWSTPSGTVGSIGIITSHLDVTKAEASGGVTRTVIAAGKHKAEGFGPLTDDTMAYLQGRVDEAYTTMVSDIGSGRGHTASEVRNGFGEGRIVSAPAAKRMGMIDRILTFDQAIDRLSTRRVTNHMKAESPEPEMVTDAPPVEPESAVRSVEDESDEDLRARLGFL